MGTRSTVKFYNQWNQKTPIMSNYNQFDGYISGVGHDLANWLKDKKEKNGIENCKSVEAAKSVNLSSKGSMQKKTLK